jgi:hypothetical protein
MGPGCQQAICFETCRWGIPDVVGLIQRFQGLIADFVNRYTGQIWGNAMGGKLGLASSRDGIRFSRTHGKLSARS